MHILNDCYCGNSTEEISISYEIIRNILNNNPRTDIIAVYTIDSGSNITAEYYAQAKAQEDIALYYNIPSINVGRALRIKNGFNNPKVNGQFTEEWLEYFVDIVHPTDKGHSFYADVICV